MLNGGINNITLPTKASLDSQSVSKMPRGQGTEAKRVSAKLKGFDPGNCKAWEAIQTQFSSGITHNELKSVATILCLQTGLQLSRLAQRDNRVLIQWFSDNWEVISPFLSTIHLFDKNKQVINLVRELRETTC